MLFATLERKERTMVQRIYIIWEKFRSVNFKRRCNASWFNFFFLSSSKMPPR
jgi:hypothetical protein